jgi:hypothetical protein
VHRLPAVALIAQMRRSARPSARWSVRGAVVILAVVLAHLSLMVSPLHAAHVEQAANLPAVAAPPPGEHGAGHTSHAATVAAVHGGHDDLLTSPAATRTLASHQAAPEDCRIQWTRTRQQPGDAGLLAVYVSPGVNASQLAPSLPAPDALATPLRRGDTQALLQVYRL